MEAGCHAPVAAEAIIENKTLTLTAAVGEIDGSRIIKKVAKTKKLDLDSVRSLAQKLAVKVKQAGAAEIIKNLKSN